MKIGMDTKYLKTVLAYFLTACAAIVLIFYFCYHLFNGFAAELELQLVTSAAENDVVALEGYLFRDETVIRAAGDGVVDYAVSDGERVGKGALLARVYAASDDGSVRRRVMAIDAEIALLEASAIGEGVVSADTSATDTQIDNLFYTIRGNLIDGRYDYARRETDSLLIQLNRRAIITGRVQNYSSRVAALSAERAALTAQLAGGAQQLRTANSGYFFYGADGYEHAFDADPMTMTLDDFDTVRAAEAVEDSRAVGKLIEDYVWYLAVPIAKSALDPFTEGERYPVTFPYNYDLTLTMTLARVLTEIDRDEALLVFSTGVMPEDFSYLRVQHVEVTTGAHVGLRVPAEAVRIYEGHTCVYIMNGGVIELRRIKILQEKNGDCIVALPDEISEETLRELMLPDFRDKEQKLAPVPFLELYDQVVTAGKDLAHGKVIT